jgi:type IV fimbrial biogenesis protein FimT
MLVGRRTMPQRTARHAGQGRTRGFTLIELVTTITVMAVLATLAIPSFSQFIMNQRIRNAAYDLMNALTQARSEAIRRNTKVDLKRATSTQPWDKGYNVLVSGGATALLDQQAYASLSITDSSDLAAITYGKDGRSLTSGTVFKIAPTGTVTGITARCVTIGVSGVPSLNVGGC